MPFQEITKGDLGGGNPNLTVTLPSSKNSGDVWVLALAQVRIANTPNWTPPGGSGWTSVRKCTGGNFGATLEVFIRTATGSEGSTHVFTSDQAGENGRACFEIGRWTGVSAVDVSNFVDQAFDTTHDSAAVTPSAANQEVAVFLLDTSVAEPYAPTASWGSTPNVQNSSTQLGLAFSRFVHPTTNSTGALTWGNNTSNVSMSVTLSLTNSSSPTVLSPGGIASEEAFGSPTLSVPTEDPALRLDAAGGDNLLRFPYTGALITFNSVDVVVLTGSPGSKSIIFQGTAGITNGVLDDITDASLTSVGTAYDVWLKDTNTFQGAFRGTIVDRNA